MYGNTHYINIYRWYILEMAQYKKASNTYIKAQKYRNGSTFSTANIFGDVYKTVIMPDGKEWLAENFRTTVIPNRPPNGDESKAATHGRLYQYNVATAITYPNGWRVPTQAEWDAMFDSVGGLTSGGKLKESSSSYWQSPNTGAIDEYGFKAMPAGLYAYGYAEFGQYAEYWCAWEGGAGYEIRYMSYNSTNITKWDWTGGYPISEYWFSVRLVRDYDSLSHSSISGIHSTADILGDTYNTVIMPDGKEWITENLKWAGAGQWWANGGTNDGDGRYYSSNEAWSTVANALAGSGWRLPSLADYDNLRDSAGGASIAGGRLKSKGTDYWLSPNIGATDMFGFNAHGSGRYWGAWDNKKNTIKLWLDSSYGGTAYYGIDMSAQSLWTGSDPLYTNGKIPIRLLRDSSIYTWKKISNTCLYNSSTSTNSILGKEYSSVLMPDGNEWLSQDFEGPYATLMPYNSITGKTSYFWEPTGGSLGSLASALVGSGWHLPTEQEILNLLSSVGSTTDEIVRALRGNTGWSTTVGSPNNIYGFNALGNGRKGFYTSLEFAGTWFTMAAWPVTPYISRALRLHSTGYGISNDTYTNYGHGVRLVKDKKSKVLLNTYIAS